MARCVGNIESEQHPAIRDGRAVLENFVALDSVPESNARFGTLFVNMGVADIGLFAYAHISSTAASVKPKHWRANRDVAILGRANLALLATMILQPWPQESVPLSSIRPLKNKIYEVFMSRT